MSKYLYLAGGVIFITLLVGDWFYSAHVQKSIDAATYTQEIAKVNSANTQAMQAAKAAQAKADAVQAAQLQAALDNAKQAVQNMQQLDAQKSVELKNLQSQLVKNAQASRTVAVWESTAIPSGALTGLCFPSTQVPICQEE